MLNLVICLTTLRFALFEPRDPPTMVDMADITTPRSVKMIHVSAAFVAVHTLLFERVPYPTRRRRDHEDTEEDATKQCCC